MITVERRGGIYIAPWCRSRRGSGRRGLAPSWPARFRALVLRETNEQRVMKPRSLADPAHVGSPQCPAPGAPTAGFAGAPGAVNGT